MHFENKHVFEEVIHVRSIRRNLCFGTLQYSETKSWANFFAFNFKEDHFQTSADSECDETLSKALQYGSLLLKELDQTENYEVSKDEKFPSVKIVMGLCLLAKVIIFKLYAYFGYYKNISRKDICRFTLNSRIGFTLLHIKDENHCLKLKLNMFKSRIN